MTQDFIHIIGANGIQRCQHCRQAAARFIVHATCHHSMALMRGSKVLCPLLDHCVMYTDLHVHIKYFGIDHGYHGNTTWVQLL